MSKGWFVTEGRGGDRTLKEQLIGLDKLAQEAIGKTILDIGCAEGLIGVELVKTGATRVVGVEIVKEHLAVARKYAVEQTEYIAGDANTFTPKPDSYDIVLFLAILHKLTDPVATAQRIGNAAKSLVVVRLPPAGPVFTDARSGNKVQDITAALDEIGFSLESDARGSFDEWIGYYRRRAVVEQPAPEENLYRPLETVTPGQWPSPSIKRDPEEEVPPQESAETTGDLFGEPSPAVQDVRRRLAERRALRRAQLQDGDGGDAAD